MTDKELKKLNRKELLELLIEQSKEVERLRAALETATARVESRDIRIQNAGSLAEASLAINGVYEAAQAAAEQYLENIKHRSEEQEATCNRMVAEAEAKAAAILEDAEKQKACKMQEVTDFWKKLSEKLETFYQEHEGLKELLAVQQKNSAE